MIVKWMTFYTLWECEWITFIECEGMALYVSFAKEPYKRSDILQKSAHGGDHTQKTWISRSNSFPVRSVKCWGLRLLTWRFAWKFGESREIMFDMYTDSRENSFEILAVVIIFKSDFLRLWSVTYVCKVDYISLSMRVWVNDIQGVWVNDIHRVWVNHILWPTANCR